MMRYAIVIEKAAGNFSAYVPDRPGCIATENSVEEVAAEIKESPNKRSGILSVPRRPASRQPCQRGKRRPSTIANTPRPSRDHTRHA
jgi:hypothetical protein